MPRVVKMAAACLVLVLAACSAPEKLILPGKVDLALAPGDRMKLCTDDGVEDTTPMSDCVVVDRTSHPIAPYEDALKAKGWTHEGTDPAERELWTLAGATSCQSLLIDAGREVMTRNRYTLLRFELSEGACKA